MALDATSSDNRTSAVFSVVAPAWNEERYIGAFLDRVSRYLESTGTSWEILVVDDGSSDRTAEIVEVWASKDRRIRALRTPHGGKGAAIRAGMLAARGDWRFMADTDLSVEPEGWEVFLAATRQSPPADVVIGSREAAGAQRVGEPLLRHLIGRVFNWVVQLSVLPGIRDTQCGFKLFSRDASALFGTLTVEGFAFDVELLSLARCSGLTIREVPVVWIARRDSRVRLSRGAAAFAEVVHIGWRHRFMRRGTLTKRDKRPTMSHLP